MLYYFNSAYACACHKLFLCTLLVVHAHTFRYACAFFQLSMCMFSVEHATSASVHLHLSVCMLLISLACVQLQLCMYALLIAYRCIDHAKKLTFKCKFFYYYEYTTMFASSFTCFTFSNCKSLFLCFNYTICNCLWKKCILKVFRPPWSCLLKKCIFGGVKSAC